MRRKQFSKDARNQRPKVGKLSITSLAKMETNGSAQNLGVST